MDCLNYCGEIQTPPQTDPTMDFLICCVEANDGMCTGENKEGTFPHFVLEQL